MNIIRTAFFTFLAATLLSCGGGGGNSGSPTPADATDYRLLAGVGNDTGNVDGIGDEARFDHPQGLAVDSSGNVYVADTYNGTVRKITSTGTVSTLAGRTNTEGSADGVGTAARFAWPQFIAVAADGNLYVTDVHAIRKISTSGVVTTFAGSTTASGASDGMGINARFSNPNGIAIDSAGVLFVADTSNHVIRRVSPSGQVTVFAGTPGVSGSADGTGSAATFNLPYAIKHAADGNLYVRDSTAIRQITPAGITTTLTGPINTIGSAVVRDTAGNFYGASEVVRKLTPSGTVVDLAGAAGIVGTTDGAGSNARFNGAADIATDSTGNLYVSDESSSTIRKITPSGFVTTLAGPVDAKGSSDGTGILARFQEPHGVASDAAGNIYVADTYNHLIRKITPAGVTTTLAGTAGVAGTVDGSGANARFTDPQAVTVSDAGRIFVADRYTVREITPTGVVTTLAGGGNNYGNTDGTGSAVSFATVTGMVVVGASLYVVDWNAHTVRRISPMGTVTTIAGSPFQSGSGDGPGLIARFNQPTGITADSAGNLYITDQGNSTIRKISLAGEVTTLAGLAGQHIVQISSTPLTGSNARFHSPSGITMSKNGYMYVAQGGGPTMKVSTAGVVSTLFLMHGPQLSGRFGTLTGIAATPTGHLVLSKSQAILITLQGGF